MITKQGHIVHIGTEHVLYMYIYTYVQCKTMFTYYNYDFLHRFWISV